MRALLFITIVAICGVANASDDFDAYRRVEAEIHKLFVRMENDDPRISDAAVEEFRRFSISSDDYDRMRPAAPFKFKGGDHPDPEVRRADLFGGMLPCDICRGIICERVWKEYHRFLESPNPAVRTVAFAHLAESFCASVELVPVTVCNCRDESSDVRAAAFQLASRLIGSLIRRDPQENGQRIEIRDLVIQALQNDHEMQRGCLYDCAGALRADARDAAPILLEEMVTDPAGDRAAKALAAVDPRPEMIEQVIAKLPSADAQLRHRAITYFTQLRWHGDGPACKALVPALSKLLADPVLEERLRVVELVLVGDYPSLHSQALNAAEGLMNDEDFGVIHDWQITEAVAMFGVDHAAGRELVVRFLRHPDQIMRSNVIHRLTFLTQKQGRIYLPDLVQVALTDPDPEVRSAARKAVTYLTAKPVPNET